MATHNQYPVDNEDALTLEDLTKMTERAKEELKQPEIVLIPDAEKLSPEDAAEAFIIANFPDQLDYVQRFARAKAAAGEESADCFITAPMEARPYIYDLRDLLISYFQESGIDAKSTNAEGSTPMAMQIYDYKNKDITVVARALVHLDWSPVEPD